MRKNIRKAALGATTAMIAASALAPDAYAHTDSLGFVISNGSGAGLYNVVIFYGSWHNGTPGPEGALDLTNTTTSTLVGTSTFQLYPGFNGVANGTLPPGLVAGVNYFFPDGNGALDGDTSSHSIYAFQFVTFNDLVSGSYQFGYNAGSSLTINWTPSDPMINAGTFIIGPNGQLVIVGAGLPTIDLSRALFTADEFSSGGDITFDGGTLQMLSGANLLSNNIIVNATGGIIDTNLIGATFGGDFTGSGIITITGGGTATLTGANLHGGFIVNNASLAISDDASLGAPGAALTLNEGTLVGLGDMTIARDIVIAGGNGGVIEVGDGLTMTLTGALSGSSCLYKRGLGELDMRANGSNAIGACVEQGEMAFNAIFTGNVWVDPGAFMSGGGTIVGDVEVSGTLSPGNSPGILVVNGSVTQLPGSTLQIDIDGPTAGTGAGYHDLLSLTGATSIFTADGELAPILRGISGAANNTYTPAIGDTFQVVTAEGGVTGRFDTLTQPADGLPSGSRLDVIYGANNIRLAVTMADYSLLANARGDAVAAATALQSIRPAPGAGAGDAGAFFDGLAGLDPDELAATFQEVSGTIHATSVDTAHRNSRTGRNAVLARLSETDASRRVWGEVIGTDAHVGDDANAYGFDYRAGGMVVGADAPVGNWVFGGALGYVESTARGEGRAALQSYQATAYAHWSEGAYFANGAASYSVDRYSIQRSVTLSTGAEALASSPDGETLGLDAEFGRAFTVGNARIDVLGAVSWDQVAREMFTETGDGAVALGFARQQDDATRLKLGARYSRDMQAMGLNVRPYAQAYAVQFTEAANGETIASLHGADFEVHSPDAGRTAVQAGLGFVAELSDRLELYAHYRGEFSDNQNEHGARLGARLSW